jgi:hypothetical protein
MRPRSLALAAVILLVLGVALFVYAGYLTTSSSLPHSPAASVTIIPGATDTLPTNYNSTFTIVTLLTNSSSPFMVSAVNSSSIVREQFVENAYLLVVAKDAGGLRVTNNLTFPLMLNYSYTPFNAQVRGQLSAISDASFLSIAAFVTGGLLGLIALAIRVRRR